MAEDKTVANKMETRRDSGFRRFSADHTLVLNLGRDVEISFLQGSPSINAQLSSDEGDEGYEMEPIIWEMARARLAPNGAVALAFLILDELSKTGRMNPESLQQSFSPILEQAQISRADFQKTSSTDVAKEAGE